MNAVNLMTRDIRDEFSAGSCRDRDSHVPAARRLRRSGQSTGARLKLGRLDQSNADLGFRAVEQQQLVLRGAPYAK
jgi:hypothetical protein